LDIIVLDTPSGEVIEICSSSCDVSIFSSKASSQHDEGTRAAPGGSSSASIGELWHDIDELDGIGCEGTSSRGHQGGAPCGWGFVPSIRGAGGSVTPASRQALVNDAPRPSTAPPRGYGECSTRNKVMRILSEAPRAISPRMRRSFIDRQYSPLTNMD
jgi:hypothetical protein